MTGNIELASSMQAMPISVRLGAAAAATAVVIGLVSHRWGR
jgi:hypothetical protein